MTVGEKLKYTYLYDLDKNVMDYLKKVKNLDKDADDLS
ncbi:aminoglycoside 6-adenylyltransferase [Kosmotoga sp. DU53]|nr:aminoglycoside 6-adenylyltransferase [Kosmotoga sp. DU53]